VTELALLEQTVDELLRAELSSNRRGRDLWECLERTGLTGAGIPEQAGGTGGTMQDAAAIVRVAAYHAAPTPLAETILIAGWALTESGMSLPDGPTTATGAGASVHLSRHGQNFVIDGTAHAVPWASGSESIVVVFDGLVACIRIDETSVTSANNIAGEPRDQVHFERVALAPSAVASAAVSPLALKERGALARAISIVGALERTLELCVEFAASRVQFGRPISHFQAVQHQLAVIAEEVVAARAATDLAIEQPERWTIAAAKARTGEAATEVASTAHQLHGAIGLTIEHELHRYTRRLWAWRDEYGSELEWSRVLGEFAVESGADSLWPILTGLGT
jgi:acyl-CoA dehydrogenase